MAKLTILILKPLAEMNTVPKF